MQDVENTVLDIIADKAKVDRATLNRDTELSSLAIESLDTVELIFQIEETFDISLPYNANQDTSAAGAGFKTAGNVIDLVAREVARRDASEKK